MGVFFIDTGTGQTATLGQLIAAGVTDGADPPPRPWLRIQGSGDASTMWYAVLRKEVREGVFIGALAIRHQPHHASLLQSGWEEVPVPEIGSALGLLGTVAEGSAEGGPSGDEDRGAERRL
jgi:hypothetical protein